MSGRLRLMRAMFKRDPVFLLFWNSASHNNGSRAYGSAYQGYSKHCLQVGGASIALVLLFAGLLLAESAFFSRYRSQQAIFSVRS